MFLKYNFNWPIKCSWTPYFSQLGLFTFRFAASFIVLILLSAIHHFKNSNTLIILDEIKFDLTKNVTEDFRTIFFRLGTPLSAFSFLGSPGGAGSRDQPQVSE